MNKLNTHTILLSIRLLMAVAMFLCMIPARAFDTSVYATNSVLSSGRWVKVSVSQSGMHRISDSSLRAMGFSDPSKVHVYGYGAVRIPEQMSLTNYVDDLPLVQSIRTSTGLIFYAQGPTTWATVSGVRQRPVQNPFTTLGYYYLSDREVSNREIPVDTNSRQVTYSDTFNETVFHESELFSAGETGHILLGESFLYNSSQSFRFDLPDRDTEQPVWTEVSFMAKSSANTKLSFTANGTKLQQKPGDYVSTVTDSHGHYKEARLTKEFPLDGTTLDFGISISNAGTLAMAALNYISVNYSRKGVLPKSGTLAFSISEGMNVSGTGASTRVWDVTRPLEIRELKVDGASGTIKVASPSTGRRQFVVFNENASLPEPKNVGVVANQDIHSMDVPDMVIFTVGQWRDQAERLAKMHAESADALNVLVLDQDLVFNEFSSGSRDANAFRRVLKMFYDRSDSEHTLRYALFMGRGVYDNRQLTASIKGLGYPLMPMWQTDGGASDIDSFTTDDVFAFLKDGSGINQGSDVLCIAVGRLPVTSQQNAREAVDKIIEYQTKMPQTSWRNRALIIADDDDNGVHMEQAEAMIRYMMDSDGGSDVSYQKLYTDQYPLVGGEYPMAREVMFKALNEGISWWFFIGHANTNSWTHERLLTYTDINSMYLRHYPIIYAACCDFLRWDAKDISAAEILWRLNSGGSIAVISANRPSYISDNGNLSRSLGQEIYKRRPDGSRPTLGEIYLNTKRRLVNDTNKLRYVLIGDPAMYPILPDNKVVVTSINGVDPEAEDAVLMARQSAVMEGYVADAAGNLIEDFDGIISSTLYDAEYSVTTRANGKNGKEVVFEQQGNRIFAGNHKVKNGRFKIDIAMPSAISNNYRPAAINLYAYRDGAVNSEQAIGMNREFYVFGEDISAVDNDAPVIEEFYLNHPTFKNGDVVNTSPMLIAKITDNRGINMSVAGIGHQMNAMLDGKRVYNDLSEYYMPESDGTLGGTIAYPISDLTPGSHTLRLRVWDTSDNSATAEIEFFVSETAAPVLYDVYSDANPASVEANFYLSHDRPDSNIEVTINIFNMMGQRVWSTTTSGRSDMFRSFPITWKLTDQAGRRVPRGIYLYRASIKSGDMESGTKTKRIAVTGN